MISISVVNWLMAEDGWTFAPGEGVMPDSVNGCDRLRDIYVLADPHCTSRVTVPVLWDKSDEDDRLERIRRDHPDVQFGLRSSRRETRRLLSRAAACRDRCGQRAVYPGLNNGVYMAGFARKQEAYEEAAERVFATLDWLERRLSRHDYLVGDN